MMGALASSTLATYQTHEVAYLSFCKGHAVASPFPLNDLVLCGFLTFYYRNNRPYSAISTAVAAIRNLARMLGHDASAVHSIRLAVLRRSLKRHCKRRAKRPQRIPITVWVLRDLLSQGVDQPWPVFFALCVVGVFGLFRGGEIAFKGGKAPLLRRADVLWLEDRVVIRLRESKTDVDRTGVDITLFRISSSTLCPYAWLRKAWDAAPDQTPSAPLFQQQTGGAVSYKFMLSWVKEALVRLGVDSRLVGLHSFRIGGATTLAMLGVPAHLIKTLGRWESLCYQIYTVAADGSLQTAMSKMAAAAGQSVPLFGGLTASAAANLSSSSLYSVPPIRFSRR